MSQSFTNQEDEGQAKVTGFVPNDRGLHEKNCSDSEMKLENQASSFNFSNFHCKIIFLI